MSAVNKYFVYLYNCYKLNHNFVQISYFHIVMICYVKENAENMVVNEKKTLSLLIKNKCMHIVFNRKKICIYTKWVSIL